MALQIYLVAGSNGGSGRSLTAAVLAYGLHLQARRTMLVRQTYDGLVSTIDPIETTLPLPCCELMLPARYELPGDLSAGLAMTIHGADSRFMAALTELAVAEVGSDGDVVVDLCCHERACNAPAIRDAAVILVPVRTSVFEIDWAVRSFAYIRDTQRYRDTPVPTLLATIAPECERARQMALLAGLLRDCDPDRDLLPGEPAEIVVEVPFLDEATLTALLDERPIWQTPNLIERCRAFAAAVAVRADAFATMLAEDADGL
uniref:CobQ/CobB/MinD/ParA nucleotide binding domain-containing protein n=1 Tax=Rhodopseudomonas palustris (strain BisA53) TaxID=316055 RepID=Q07SK5_RHOP5